MWLVQDNITCLKGGDKPATTVFLCKFRRELGQQTRRHHIRVEGRSSLFLRQASQSRLVRELLFNLLADAIACNCQNSCDLVCPKEKGRYHSPDRSTPHR